MKTKRKRKKTKEERTKNSKNTVDQPMKEKGIVERKKG